MTNRPETSGGGGAPAAVPGGAEGGGASCRSPGFVPAPAGDACTGAAEFADGATGAVTVICPARAAASRASMSASAVGGGTMTCDEGVVTAGPAGDPSAFAGAGRTEAATNTAGGGARLGATPSGMTGARRCFGQCAQRFVGQGYRRSAPRRRRRFEHLRRIGGAQHLQQNLRAVEARDGGAEQIADLQVRRQRGCDAITEDVDQVGQAVRRQHLRRNDLPPS